MRENVEALNERLKITIRSDVNRSDKQMVKVIREV